MQVRASVKCVNATHDRASEAGVILATDGKNPPESVTVKWDTDGATAQVDPADLVELGTN